MKKEASNISVVPTNKCRCEICGTVGLGGFHAFVIDGKIKEYCAAHKSQAPTQKGHWGIWDATGKLRDRSWLDKKIAITKNDKTWEADIKSRRNVSSTEVGRFDGSRRIG